MKLKIKNFEIYNSEGKLERGFLMDLIELDSMKTSTRIQYNCMRSIKECRRAIHEFQEQRKKILEQSCTNEKNQKGEYIFGEDNQYTYETPEIKQEAIDEVNKLFNMEVEIEILSSPIKEALDIKEPMAGGLLGRLTGRFFIEEESK